jgi:hypothetical protein
VLIEQLTGLDEVVLGGSVTWLHEIQAGLSVSMRVFVQISN